MTLLPMAILRLGLGHLLDQPVLLPAEADGLLRPNLLLPLQQRPALRRARVPAVRVEGVPLPALPPRAACRRRALRHGANVRGVVGGVVCTLVLLVGLQS